MDVAGYSAALGYGVVIPLCLVTLAFKEKQKKSEGEWFCKSFWGFFEGFFEWCLFLWGFCLVTLAFLVLRTSGDFF